MREAFKDYNNYGGYTPPYYDVGYDWYGPQFFFPPQCVRQTSWTIPKRGSPIVAIIDNSTDPNPISADVNDYFNALKKVQRHTAAWLIVPSYYTMWFNSQEELYDYIASPDYLKDPDH